jgi:hypothetical protein
MKINTSYLALFIIFTVFLGSAVAIDWELLNPKYWGGILVILMWATIGCVVLRLLSEER